MATLDIAVERDILELSRLLREHADPSYVSELAFFVRRRFMPEDKSTIEQIADILRSWPTDRVEFLLKQFSVIPASVADLCTSED